MKESNHKLESMLLDDKINRIEDILDVLLVYLIRKKAEHRSVSSWDIRIKNCVDRINRINRCRQVKDYYFSRKELSAAIEDTWRTALRTASLQAFEGSYDQYELARMLDEEQIKNEVLAMIDKLVIN